MKVNAEIYEFIPRLDKLSSRNKNDQTIIQTLDAAIDIINGYLNRVSEQQEHGQVMQSLQQVVDEKNKKKGYIASLTRQLSSFVEKGIKTRISFSKPSDIEVLHQKIVNGFRGLNSESEK